jgi:hypothetical protein
MRHSKLDWDIIFLFQALMKYNWLCGPFYSDELTEEKRNVLNRCLVIMV